MADSYDGAVPTRITSDSAVNFSSSEKTPVNIRSWNTTGDLGRALKGTKDKWEKRSVRFSGAVRVVLIASVEEYTKAGLLPVLWYTEEDYTAFKVSALKEYNEMMAKGHLTRKEVIHALYQQSPQVGSSILSDTGEAILGSLEPSASAIQTMPSDVAPSPNTLSTPEKISSATALAFSSDACDGVENVEDVPVFCITADSAQKFKESRTRKTSNKPQCKLSSESMMVTSPIALMCDV